MDFIVTYEDLLNVSSSIIQNADKYCNTNQLLDDFICNQYNILENRKKLLTLFSKFNSAKYLYHFPPAENIKVSNNYDINESSFQRSAISQVENAVERYVDKQILTTKIYQSLLVVSSKLTNDEATYLINTFMAHKSEDDIADIIGISKTYLQKVKKSCIVKMWVELEQYCEKND